MDRSRINSVQWSEGEKWTKLSEALKMARILGGCQNVVSEFPIPTLFHYHKKLEGKEIKCLNYFHKKNTGVLKSSDLELLQDCIIS
eukprot:5612744-Ditylum_brightwellii.AAC.1